MTSLDPRMGTGSLPIFRRVEEMLSHMRTTSFKQRSRLEEDDFKDKSDIMSSCFTSISVLPLRIGDAMVRYSTSSTRSARMASQR